MSEWSNERPPGGEPSPWAPNEPARPAEPHGQPNPYAPQQAPQYGPPEQYGQYGQPNQYGPPNQYGYPPYGPANQYGYGYQYGQMPAATDSLAIVSLVLSILGIAICPLVFGVAGLICGYIARRRIREAGGRLEGSGIALAGIIIGWLQVGATVAIVGVMIAVSASSSPY